MDDVNVLFEDNHILVVVKPQNIPVMADDSGDLDLLTLLKGWIKQRDNKPGEVYLGLVHRLAVSATTVMISRACGCRWNTPQKHSTITAAAG